MLGVDQPLHHRVTTHGGRQLQPPQRMPGVTVSPQLQRPAAIGAHQQQKILGAIKAGEPVKRHRAELRLHLNRKLPLLLPQ